MPVYCFTEGPRQVRRDAWPFTVWAFSCGHVHQGSRPACVSGPTGKEEQVIKYYSPTYELIFNISSSCCDEERDWHKLTEDVRGPLFFFSAFSRSSNSMFSRSMSVMSVLHLLWSSCGHKHIYRTVLGLSESSYFNMKRIRFPKCIKSALITIQNQEQ